VIDTAAEDVNAAEYARLNTLVTSLKSTGVWDRLTVLWVPVGGNLSAAQRCIKHSLSPGSGYRMDITAFQESEWNRLQGLDGRLMLDRSLTTGLIGNDITFDDSHLSLWIEPPENNATGRRDFGVITDNNFQLNVFNSLGVFRSKAAMGIETVALTPDTLGLMVGTRTGSDALFYQNGELRQQVVATGGNVSSPNAIHIFRARAQQSGKVLSAASIGLGLSVQQVADYSAAMATFRNSR